MAASTKSGIERLERVAAVRQTLASVAEARVREAENDVRVIELDDERIVRKIIDSKAEIAQRPGLTGHDIQQNEKYIEALQIKRRTIMQSLEKAKTRLAMTLREWVEAKREQKIIERLQERRLQEWTRQEDIVLQKSVDEAFIGRMVRSRKQE